MIEAEGLNANRQALLAVIAGLPVISLGCMFGWPITVKHEITCHNDPIKNITLMQNSWMVAIFHVGAFISPMIVTNLMDYVGRKHTLLILTLLPLMSWIILLFASHVNMFYIGRFLGGLWGGTIPIVAPVYIAEVTGPKLRDFLTTVFLTSTLAGVFIDFVGVNYTTYCVLTALGFLITFCFVLCFWFMPASPDWLAKNGYIDEASDSLTWLKGSYVPLDMVEQEILNLNLGTYEATQDLSHIKDFFSNKGRRRAFITLQLLALAQTWSGIAEIVPFIHAIVPDSAVKPFETILSIEDYKLVFGTVILLFTFLNKYCINFWNRKLLLQISMVGGGIGTFFIGLWNFLKREKDLYVDEYSWVMALGLITYFLCIIIGIGTLTQLKEMFSVNDRILIVRCTVMTISLASCISNMLYLPISTYFGLYFNFWIYTIYSAISAVFVQLYMIETKGKTLQEIYEELESK
ncbi:facilitated trehalose transporter Tret1-like [Rhodnius prolixus]|uniref:MFS domain-containing protein n=1 Tax=Rhodnius prolixus TaxID=13249 RepID=T1I5Y7_RHOPR